MRPRPKSMVAFVLVPLMLVLAAVEAPGLSVASPFRSTQPALFPKSSITGVTAPRIPSGAHTLGALSATQRLDMDMTLRLPNPGALQSYIADLSDRSSPLFHHFLRRGQFGPMFGPSLSTVRAVESVLRREGFAVLSLASDRLSMRVASTVGAAERAFHVVIDRYRLASGRVAYANRSAPMLPTSIVGDVQAILGLNDLSQEQSMVARPLLTARRGARGRHDVPIEDTAGPKPCAAATNAANTYGSLTADQLAAYYSMSPLYSLGDLGQGVNVALAELEPDSPRDIAVYEACYGLHTAVNYYAVDGGAGSGPGSGEAALDIEDVMGLAPEATIDVYQAPNSDPDILDLFTGIVDDDTDQVVSTSWGECELDTEDSDPGFISSEQTLFAQAASQAQTVFASAGDNGSTDCYGNGTSNSSSLSVDDPASQPYVLGVGGTSIGSGSENVWNDSADSDGAGGGGVSAEWCMPPYQDQTDIPGLVNSDSVKDSTDCSSSSSSDLLRQVPDVSADADPETGYTIYYTGSSPGLTDGWGAIGGTSAAAPLWAAVTALIDASPFCNDYDSNVDGDAGVLPDGLYQVVASNSSYIYDEPNGGYEALYDVTSGNDDYTPSGYDGGLYRATTGYDMASGLGTPAVSGLTASGAASTFYPGLAALMCWEYGLKLNTSSITGAHPDIGLTNASTTVTITGTGFLPIAGADRLLIGSKAVVPSCRSTTRCTAVLPPTGAGSVNLRMVVEDYLTESPVASADRFTFAPSPVVHVTSPSSDFQLSRTVFVRYSASVAGSSVSAYAVRYRDAPWNSASYGNYIYPSAWQATTGTSQHLSGTPGDEYCFDVRVRAASGVVSAWTPDHCTTLPLGARSLRTITAGWTRHNASNDYLGSYVESRIAGAELRIVGAELGLLSLVVTECRSCGDVAIYLNGKKFRTLSTRAGSTRDNVVLTLPSFSFRKATIVLKEVSKGRPVVIEGIGIV